jgi:hypothetical protein
VHVPNLISRDTGLIVRMVETSRRRPGKPAERDKDVDVNANPTPEDLPAAQSSRLIEFERADVISPMIYPPRPTLVVTGQKPWANMKVSLKPLTYIRQPEYWGIEVVGAMPAIGQPAIIPYAVELELDGTIGTAGIEVIGANRTEKIDVAAPESGEEVVGVVEDGRLRRLYPLGPGARHFRLTTVSTTDGTAPESGEIDLSGDDGALLRVRGDRHGGWIYSADVLERQPASILSIIARHVFAG